MTINKNAPGVRALTPMRMTVDITKLLRISS